MEIKLYPHQFLHNKGKRENNEDAIYPNEKTENPLKGLYLVCDGVGGSEKGEVASELALNSFVNYISSNPTEKYDQTYFSKALDHAENEFDHYIENNPNAKGMATTLTLACFNKLGASLVHTGDSRIYHLRSNAIIFQTKDHSYVNHLVDIGEITEEQALVHPERNILLHAISGKSNRPTKVDVYETQNIDPGDYFFLCSDGILEAVSDENLIEILFENISNQDKIDRIKSLCEENANDNFSCILLQVASIQLEEQDETLQQELTKPLEEEEKAEKEEIVETPNRAINPSHSNKEKRAFNNKYLLIIIAIVIALSAAFWVMLNNQGVFNEKKKRNPQTEKVKENTAKKKENGK
ncbi:MAG: protein phosphatase 2C domain-containing protein [Dysgonamonadaceae bacterium]|jgi:protein phosphatase|nr:protein phosphatase 2C domain-containing protein [Dysgonamonadaceae bacterium]